MKTIHSGVDECDDNLGQWTTSTLTLNVPLMHFRRVFLAVLETQKKNKILAGSHFWLLLVPD